RGTWPWNAPRIPRIQALPKDAHRTRSLTLRNPLRSTSTCWPPRRVVGTSRSPAHLQGAALYTAAAEEQLGQVAADGVVAALAELALEVRGARGDDHVVAVGVRIEAENGGILFVHDHGIRVPPAEDGETRLVEGARQVGDVRRRSALGIEHGDGGIEVVEARVD